MEALIFAVLGILALVLWKLARLGRRVERRERSLEASRVDAIEDAREEVRRLTREGAIFEVTTASRIPGHHVRELGWVSFECDSRSTAEKWLRKLATEKYSAGNVLTKLTCHTKDERYRAGTGPKGNPYYKTDRVKVWEAAVGEAMPDRRVDKSPQRWDPKIAVLDGSNIAHWGNQGASLATVARIVSYLREEGTEPIVVFDANIGFKVSPEGLAQHHLREALGPPPVKIEIVPAGTVADRRIIEIAEELGATIVSNDLFRDSRRARFIPKRRGFYLPSYDHAELGEPRT